MANQQLYLAIGIPSFLVVLAMLTNFVQTGAIGKRMDKLEHRMEKLDSRMNQLMQQMLTFQAALGNSIR